MKKVNRGFDKFKLVYGGLNNYLLNIEHEEKQDEQEGQDVDSKASEFDSDSENRSNDIDQDKSSVGSDGE